MHVESSLTAHGSLVFFPFPLFYCAVACPTVEDPMNGNLVLGVVNDRLVYQTQCDAGYLVNGGLSGIFECQPDGTFSSAIPTCVGKPLGQKHQS